MDLGRIGIWTGTLDSQPMGRSQEAVGELEAMGYAAVWVPEAVGREALTNSALLLAGGERIVVATGIANLWARDAVAMAGASRTIASAYPDRFLLGIGVSHSHLVERVRGHDYSRPLEAMRTYLDDMDGAIYFAVPPEVEPTRVIAALGPKMLALAAEKTAGAHPYFVPPEHTVVAREALGQGPLLLPEQAVLFETDPSRAREIARAHTKIYVGLPNYANNLKRLGFTDDDFLEAGSDRLVDAIVAWGDTETVKARVQAHLDAGADHVCVQVLEADPRALPMDGWRELAAAFDLTAA